MPRRSLYKGSDSKRYVPAESKRAGSSREFRSPWRRDYGRVIHSPAFRRLQGKTQLFYGNEIVVRNRLTHSLEVAQIAKSIAIKLQSASGLSIEPEIAEVAGLIHDLGHPPFGHNGEDALDRRMRWYGGFESNAQTLRIIARLEKRRKHFDADGHGFSSNGEDMRYGLNLTYRVLASALKYDEMIPLKRPKSDKIDAKKGFYYTEAPLVKAIKRNVLGQAQCSEWPKERDFKTIECQIMDVADDIAYSTYDLEDAFKAGLVNPLDMLAVGPDAWTKYERIAAKIQADTDTLCTAEAVHEALLQILAVDFEATGEELLARVPSSVKRDGLRWNNALALAAVFHEDAKSLASNGYRRLRFTSALVDQFVEGVNVDVDEEFPSQSRVYLNRETRLLVEVLKRFAYVSIIESPRLRIPEHRGREVVETIFDALLESGRRLLPNDFGSVFTRLGHDRYQQRRLVADFVAGMTDHYAMSFYKRLMSEDPATLFGPGL